MDYKETAKRIVELIGGSENIESVTHCFTRLRFKLKEDSKAETEKIKSLEKVMGVAIANGQYQIIIGNDVKYVYTEIEKLVGGKTTEVKETRKYSFKEILNIIASIFTPTIPALAGAGVIKGLLVLFTTYGLMEKTGTTYMILTAASDAVFYFMPIILGYTSAKVFECNEVICMTIGASLIYPTLITYMTETTSMKFFGIPVVSTTYASTVIPIILAVYVYSKLEKLLEKVIPNMIKAVISPMLSLIVMVPATLIIFGPFGNYTSELVGKMFQTITAVSPMLAGAFFGGSYSILVMFGMHRALVPIGVNEVSTMGSTTLWAFTGPSNFAQAGAAFGTFLRLKDKKMKSVALSASVTALFGITEPALYGVNLKYKKPMASVVVCGALGGAIAGIGGAKAYAVAIPSILTLPTFLGEGFAAYMISIIVAFVSACVMTVIIGIDEKKSGDSRKEQSEDEGLESQMEEEITAPVSGSVIAMENIHDETFAQGILGEGCAIEPIDGKVYAPVDGQISSLFDTKHAFGITSQGGAEILIHIGIDTVNLQGKYFRSHIKENEYVKKGQLLVEFDNEEIKKEGYRTETIILVTNIDEFEKLEVVKESSVENGKTLMWIRR